MKRPSRMWIVIGAAALVVVIVAVVLVRGRESRTEVQVEQVEPRDLTAIVTASGTVEPKRSVSISATTPGEVVRVGVSEGQRVSRGDFLLQIDPVNFEAGERAQTAALEAARADLAQAEARFAFADEEYERKRSLVDAELISRSEFQSAEAEKRAGEAAVAAARRRVEQADATLRSAQHDLRRVTVRSPIDGVITRVNVEPGEVAVIGTMNQPGTVLLVVADLGVMETTVEVDETDVVHVEVGQQARILVDAFPDTTFAGHVTEVATSPIIIPTVTGPADGSTDFEVKITLDDVLPAVRSGLSASADIVTAERDDALTIPIQSLVVRQTVDDAAGTDGIVEREGAFLVRDGVVRFVPVRVGISGERHFEVVRGLERGDRIVSGSYQALRDLRDGDRVKIVEADDEQGS